MAVQGDCERVYPCPRDSRVKHLKLFLLVLFIYTFQKSFWSHKSKSSSNLKFIFKKKNHIFQCMGKIFCVDFQKDLWNSTQISYPFIERCTFIEVWNLNFSLDLGACMCFWNVSQEFQTQFSIFPVPHLWWRESVLDIWWNRLQKYGAPRYSTAQLHTASWTRWRQR